MVTGLVHDHQHQPVRRGHLLQDVAEPGSVVGQGLVEDRLPCNCHGYRVGVGLTDVHIDEHRRPLLL